jgi:hypothetical protein
MKVDEFEHGYEKRVIKLRAHCELLFKIIKSFPTLHVEQNESYRYVLLGFFRRLVDSTENVFDVRFNRDNLLIARSSLEGIALLKWIYRIPELREKRARDYLGIQLVELQIRMQQMKERGFPWSEEHVNGMKNEIMKLSNELIPPDEYAKFVYEDEPLRHKKFIERLTQGTVKDLMLAAGHPDVYHKTYAYLSGYHHWNPYQLFGCLDQKLGLQSYGVLPSEEFDSLLCNVVALIECSALVAQEYGLYQYQELASLERSIATIV